MTKIYSILIATAAISLFAGCGEHSCSLDSETDKKNFGDIAAMTAGANSCMVSSGELIAVHPDKTKEDVAAAYEAKLKEVGYTATLEDYEGERGNGGKYTGKRIIASKGDKKVGIIVYPLTENLIETVTVVQ